jgi:hypothetical protein
LVANSKTDSKRLENSKDIFTEIPLFIEKGFWNTSNDGNFIERNTV